MTGVALRPHPYPYRASLAVCNDADWSTPEGYLALHRFLNTRESTDAGEGLGLDVGDACWLYTNNPFEPNRFTYFEGVTDRPGPHAGLIRDGIRSGWIDTLHTYGDFDGRGGFTRPLAERGLEELARHGLRLTAWTNHSGPHNLQNLLADGLGDLPENGGEGWHYRYPVLEYHSDLALAHGIRYLWQEQDLTDIVGQDRPYSLFRYHRDRGLGSLQALWRAARDRRSPPKPGREALVRNRLLEPVRLRDGRMAFSFLRYGFWRYAGAADLPRLLSDAVLDGLEGVRGSSVLFVHLGLRRDPSGPLLLPEAARALSGLARRAAEGRIWVARTSRLLERSRIARYLRWTAAREGGGWTVRLGPVEDPVDGRWEPSAEALSGLAFYTQDASRTRVLHADGRPLPVKVNPPDDTGRASVSLV